MKPFTVILRVRLRGTFGPYMNSRPIPVYGTDEAEAVARAKRLVELEPIETSGAISVTEGWLADSPAWARSAT